MKNWNNPEVKEVAISETANPKPNPNEGKGTCDDWNRGHGTQCIVWTNGLCKGDPNNCEYAPNKKS